MNPIIKKHHTNLNAQNHWSVLFKKSQGQERPRKAEELFAPDSRRLKRHDKYNIIYYLELDFRSGKSIM